MEWKPRHTWGIVAVVLGTGFYFYLIHRSLDVKDAEGWHLEFSYKRFHCRVCHGRAEKLTHDGAPVLPPDWRWETDDGSTAFVQIRSPEGDFSAWRESPHWRLWHTHLLVEEIQQRVEPGELSRGWYDAIPSHTPDYAPGYGPYVRKIETPAFWCLLTTFDQARWVDPREISGLDW